MASDYTTEESAVALLRQGHCVYPGAFETGKIWQCDTYEEGGEANIVSNTKEYILRGQEEVRFVYLFRRGKWYYANTMFERPRLMVIQIGIAQRLKEARLNKSENFVVSHS